MPVAPILFLNQTNRLNPYMTTYFISDLHMEKIESPNETFSEFLKRLNQNDTFIYWATFLILDWDDNVSELSQFVIDQLIRFPTRNPYWNHAWQ
ncbi:MAG: hypothetical protein Ct9H90mP13_03690 [Pseudomonadota bacterium]|nr:MAG: hypothetical protein Ct9H90mP13_03690 [Pseudomonadota bacterium]